MLGQNFCYCVVEKWNRFDEKKCFGIEILIRFQTDAIFQTRTYLINNPLCMKSNLKSVENTILIWAVKVNLKKLENMAQCKLCDKTFDTQVACQKHMKFDHLLENPFKCPFVTKVDSLKKSCTKQYGNYVDLVGHLQNRHGKNAINVTFVIEFFLPKSIEMTTVKEFTKENIQKNIKVSAEVRLHLRRAFKTTLRLVNKVLALNVTFVENVWLVKEISNHMSLLHILISKIMSKYLKLMKTNLIPMSSLKSPNATNVQNVTTFHWPNLWWGNTFLVFIALTMNRKMKYQRKNLFVTILILICHLFLLLTNNQQ